MKVFRNLFVLVIVVLIALACSKEEDVVPFEKQMEIDLAIIDEYLLDKGITALIDEETGLRYVVHDAGTGKAVVPSVLPCVTFGYEGRLLSNESIFAPRDTIEYPLHKLIAGFQIGLPFIAEQGSITLYIPSRYGYGPKGTGPIPGDANIIFDVDLITVGAFNSETGSCE